MPWAPIPTKKNKTLRLGGGNGGPCKGPVGGGAVGDVRRTIGRTAVPPRKSKEIENRSGNVPLSISSAGIIAQCGTV